MPVRKEELKSKVSKQAATKQAPEPEQEATKQDPEPEQEATNQDLEPEQEVTKQAPEPEQEASAPKKAVITAPNSNYCGIIGGVGFVSGKAELENTEENMRMLHWFKDNGYEVYYV